MGGYTWPIIQRLKSQPLTLHFLAEYSAAVQAEVVYAIALGAKQDRHDSNWRNKKNVGKPAH